VLEFISVGDGSVRVDNVSVRVDGGSVRVAVEV
jgi:hypothetical protein